MSDRESADADADAVVFEVGAEFGHFRKPHASPPKETYGIPPRTTAVGLVAAMLGLERDSYYDTFGRETSQVAVSVEAPIRRQVHGTNELDTKGLKSKSGGAQTARHITGHRDPTPVSLLSRPRYRLYISVNDHDLMDGIDAVVRGADDDAPGGRAPTYGPAMGTSSHLAWIDYIGRFPIEPTDADDDADGTVAIRSAVPGERIPLVVDPERHYVSETMTAFMRADDDGGRTPIGSHTVTYARSGAPLELRAAEAEYAVVGEDHVVFS